MNQESEGSASIQSDSFREKTCSNSVENIGLQLIFKSLQEVWVLFPVQEHNEWHKDS